MQRIVINKSQINDHKITFSSEQYHYIFNVLRLKNEENIIAMDGKGETWLLEIKSDYGKIVKEIINNTELDIDVTLMVALPKGNGFEDIVRCCTELGVKRIIPVESDRSLLKPSANKVQRWRKIAIEAAEQSERIIVPEILEPIKFSQVLLKEELGEYNKYICVTRSDSDHIIKTVKKEDKNIIIATGPEGGWTEKEVELAINNKFTPVSLGKRILRAVTAPITVMSILGAIDNDN